MDFKQKLDVVIGEIKDVYNLNEGQASLIKKNLINRANMYQSMKPNFNTNETKIVVNSSNIGDFLINRLVTNIREYEFDQNYNRENTEKGTYTSFRQQLYVAKFDFIEDITREKLERRMPNVDKETLRKATVNVFNHEMGHALQSAFEGRQGFNDSKYNQLIERLTTKYPNDFKLQATNEALTEIHAGMRSKRKKDEKEKIRNYYAGIVTLLDEIFNEDEALRITGVTQPQFQYDMGSGFSKNIYNYQSSNYKITSYGRMMKIIMGETKTFQSMYEDSIIAYEFFDQFKELSDKVFEVTDSKEIPPMVNIINALIQIKGQSSLVQSHRLDLFLTECLRMKVSHELKRTDITQDDINYIKGYIEEFTNQMLKNPNIQLPQDVIISNINNAVLKKERQLSNRMGTNQNTRKTMNSQEITEAITNLRVKLTEVNLEYNKMKADGRIDVNELNSFISRMNSLMSVVNDLQIQNLNEEETKIVNFIKSHVTNGLNAMHTFYTVEEEPTISSGGYGR